MLRGPLVPYADFSYDELMEMPFKRFLWVSDQVAKLVESTTKKK